MESNTTTTIADNDTTYRGLLLNVYQTTTQENLSVWRMVLEEYRGLLHEDNQPDTVTTIMTLKTKTNRNLLYDSDKPQWKSES